MNAPIDRTPLPWAELNRDWLAAQIARLAARIEGRNLGALPADPTGFTPALAHCASAFGLSHFEGEVLLLLAGIEIDGGLRRAVGGAASFSLALGALEGAHWDALSPDAPLRRWDLIEVEAGGPLALAPLRIDERVLHFLCGVPASDPLLAALTLPLTEADEDHPLAPRVAAALSGDRPRPVALSGDGEEARALAQAVAVRLGRGALLIEAGEMAGQGLAPARLARRLDREGRLSGALPVLSVGEAGMEAAVPLAARLRDPFLWIGPPPPRRPAGEPPLRLDVPPPDAQRTQARLLQRWRRTSPEADTALEAALGRAAGQFRLSSAGLDAVIDTLRAAPEAERPALAWTAARAAARGGLNALARRIETRVTFGDLVLPSGPAAILRDIARELRHRETVWRSWGFGAKHDLGQGLVALFAGESGTGKTLAAEAVATEAGLDLYRVDLASLVSKWIGETEKNLAQLFEAAEASGAVLLFDEADALFGRRGEVRDSHDRHANLEVAYLLQRVEAYRGLAVLTTNMRSTLDRAFLRRIRFVLTFPLPDAAARERIWRGQFPPQAPLGEVDWEALARLALSGGHIRATAVAAAFKAADRGGVIDRALLMEAAREELAKMERSVTGGQAR